MSELTFYTNPVSRGRIIRWMLEETGTAYKTEILGCVFHKLRDRDSGNPRTAISVNTGQRFR